MPGKSGETVAKSSRAVGRGAAWDKRSTRAHRNSVSEALSMKDGLRTVKHKIRGALQSRRLAGPDQEDGNLGLVAHLLDGLAIEQVAQQAVAVGGHGDQVAVLRAGGLQDLLGRLAQSVKRLHLEPLPLELRAHSLQVLAVLLHFSRVRQVKIALPLRRPARGHVDQEDARPRKARQFLHARQQSGVRAAVVESDEDLFEHDLRNSKLEMENVGPESKIANPKSKMAYIQLFKISTIQ